MCCVGFIKRFAPFFLTFAVGLFIASFFVTIAAPNFKFGRGFNNRHRQYHQRLESENRQMREENSRLKSDLEKQKIKNQSDYTYEWETRDSNSPLIRENQNFQPRIERDSSDEIVPFMPKKAK